MNTETRLFLDELKALLEKHNACIVRSANNRGDLCTSQRLVSGEFVDIKFNEEINPSSIEFEWYAECEQYTL